VTCSHLTNDRWPDSQSGGRSLNLLGSAIQSLLKNNVDDNPRYSGNRCSKDMLEKDNSCGVMANTPGEYPR
jgi:hypothetical protein